MRRWRRRGVRRDRNLCRLPDGERLPRQRYRVPNALVQCRRLRRRFRPGRHANQRPNERRLQAERVRWRWRRHPHRRQHRCPWGRWQPVHDRYLCGWRADIRASRGGETIQPGWRHGVQRKRSLCRMPDGCRLRKRRLHQRCLRTGTGMHDGSEHWRIVHRWRRRLSAVRYPGLRGRWRDPQM